MESANENNNSSQKTIHTRSFVANTGAKLTSPARNLKKRQKPGILSDSIAEMLNAENKDEVSILEQNLHGLFNEAQPANREVIAAIMAGQKITSAKLQPLDAALKQINKNTCQIAKVEEEVSQMKNSQSNMEEKIAFLDQSRLENQASITGFKLPPDEDELKTILCDMFKLEQSTIVKVQSFSINSKSGPFTVINVHFTNSTEKAKLITAKIAHGEVKARHFFPSLSELNGANAIIYIGHKLTSANLQIRKAIIDQQKAGNVDKKRFRNNRFQIQLTNVDKWINVNSTEHLTNITTTRAN